MTKIADLIVHDEFAQYFQQAMLDRSTLLKSGIAAVDPAIAERCAAAGAGGNFVHLPFFNSLDTADNGDAEVLVEDGALTPKKITADEDIAVICRRGKAFASTDLAAMNAGADPMLAIANGLADWWNKQHTKRLIATLNGALGAAGATLVKTLVSGTPIDADALLDAAQLLGDRKSELTAYAMNSATETDLQKLEGSNLFKPSDLPGNLKVYNERSVIVDDNIPANTVYLFAPGAVAFNACPIDKKFEPYRETLKSQGGIVTRDASILHVRGIKWAKTTTNPTNDALGTAGNWALAYPAKAIRVCKLTVSAA